MDEIFLEESRRSILMIFAVEFTPSAAGYVKINKV